MGTAAAKTATPDRRVRSLAKTMRKRMTRQEYRLYSGFLSSLPVTVCRQKIIGKYIVDFLIPSAMLVIEVDGAQHYSEKGLENDRQRDAFLRSEGYSVLRYSNSDIMTISTGWPMTSSTASACCREEKSARLQITAVAQGGISLRGAPDFRFLPLRGRGHSFSPSAHPAAHNYLVYTGLPSQLLAPAVPSRGADSISCRARGKLPGNTDD